jgi:hypothetical protein
MTSMRAFSTSITNLSCHVIEVTIFAFGQKSNVAKWRGVIQHIGRDTIEPILAT